MPFFSHSVSPPTPILSFGNLTGSQLTQTIHFCICDITNRLPKGNIETHPLVLPHSAKLEGEGLGFHTSHLKGSPSVFVYNVVVLLGTWLL